MKVRIKRPGSLKAGFTRSFRTFKAGVGLKAGVARAELSGSVGGQPGHVWGRTVARQRAEPAEMGLMSCGGPGGREHRRPPGPAGRGSQPSPFPTARGRGPGKQPVSTRGRRDRERRRRKSRGSAGLLVLSACLLIL